MRVPPLLLLASGFLPLASWGYLPEEISLEAAGRIEGRGEGKHPVAIMEGTTDLPDRAILRFSVYYEKIDLSQELNYRREHVMNGALRTEIEIPTGDPFPGLYQCRIDFDATSQYQTTREAMGERMRSQTWTIAFRVGTEQDADTARTRVRQDMIAIFTSLMRIQKEVHDAYTRMMQKQFDVREWSKQVHQWHGELDGLANPRIATTVTKVLSLDMVRHYYLEEMAESVHSIIDLSAAGLAGDKKDPGLWTRLNRAQHEFKKSYESVMKRLGAVAFSEDDVKKHLENVVRAKETWMHTMRDRARGKVPEEQWQKTKDGWMPDFLGAVIALTEVAPDFTYKQATKIMEDGQTLYEESLRLADDPEALVRLEPAVTQFDTTVQQFWGLLDGTYLYPDPPQDQAPHGTEHGGHQHQPQADHEPEPGEDKQHDHHPK